MKQDEIVYVVDDDVSVREALDGLLRSVGIVARIFGSTKEFLSGWDGDPFACLVLDVRMPGQSGLEFQQQLLKSNIQLPIIFISAHGDIPMSVQAMKAGAVEFLPKPFREQALLDAIQAALKKARSNHHATSELKDLQDRFDALSERERQVMAQVAGGRLNKQIAAQLGLSEITVKIHRAQAMRKLGAKSIVDLVRMADKLQISVE